jgi:hypothetical protein
MTLDITIGQVCIEEYGNKAYVSVSPCVPETYDVCDPKYAVRPRAAKRSGAVALYGFFNKYLYDIYTEMRDYPDSNDQDVAFITPWIDRINALDDQCDDPIRTDCMKWLKFWCNRAVTLYGDDAAIKIAGYV